MTQLSKHFSLEEMTKSSTASRMGIDNTPNEEQIENLKAICENILEPLREYYESRPITITSGFRSPELSEAIKSSRRESRSGDSSRVCFSIPEKSRFMLSKLTR